MCSGLLQSVQHRQRNQSIVDTLFFSIRLAPHWREASIGFMERAFASIQGDSRRYIGLEARIVVSFDKSAIFRHEGLQGGVQCIPESNTVVPTSARQPCRVGSPISISAWLYPIRARKLR